MTVFPDASNVRTSSGIGTSDNPSPYVARKTSSSPRYGSIALSRSPIVACMPVSANVIFQELTSRFRISTCASAP